MKHVYRLVKGAVTMLLCGLLCTAFEYQAFGKYFDWAIVVAILFGMIYGIGWMWE